MILFTNDDIYGEPLGDPTVPFQPGEVYLVRYMTLPTIVTVRARTASDVSVWFGLLDVEDFNERVLFKLGTRARLLGLWLPFVRCRPERVFANGMPDGLGSNQAFWVSPVRPA